MNNPVPGQFEASIGVVAPGTPPPEGIRRLQVLLIKPSKYDDAGYVLRYLRGVLPSNTLAALWALSEEVAKDRLLGDVEIGIEALDELVQRIDARKLARKHRRHDVRTVVAICGVQTNQFPRAADLAREFRAEGLPVMMGGFHVSGAIALSDNGMPPECQALLDRGVTLVKGEVEECWGDLLRDALHGRLKPFYDIVASPDISRCSIPLADPRLLKKFVDPSMGTIDAGRGCPFRCSFCCIINVQGRKMRTRSAARIKEHIRASARRGIDCYFFTDDNFSRNPEWEEILDGIIELRRDEGISIHFLMQVDTQAHRLSGFVAKAAEAGCYHVFIGMESLNPADLAAAGKSQNRVADYRAMIQAWHAHSICCHVGYIIGFPHDTARSVREDVRRLRDEIGVDMASFFMLTPLPGSRDYCDLKARGGWMEEDLNRFDSFHPTVRHPRMSAEEWFEAYRGAWRDFYSIESMKKILSRTSRRIYWGLFKNFLWYRHSAVVEGTHPMICGFFQRKGRRERRPGFAVDPAWRHLLRRTREVARWFKDGAKLFFQMQEVWLATRGRAKLEENLEDLRSRYKDLRARLGESAARAGQALSRQVASVRAGAGEAWHRAGRAGRSAAEDLAVRLRLLRGARGSALSRLRAFAARLNPFSPRIQTRAHLNAYWRSTAENLLHGRFLRINPFTLAFNFFRDAQVTALFALSVLLHVGK